MKPRRIERRVPSADVRFLETLHPLLKHVYATRPVHSIRDLDNTVATLHDFRTLSNMDAAVALLTDCLLKQKRILIIGDYDVDGATSTALGVRVLRRLGATHVDYLVPNRFEYGYGLTPEIVVLAKERKPDLIITVDNGVSSIAGVAAARNSGIQVLVTDHHLPGGELPVANAIVNPNLEGDMFPSKCLAGVGVMFYVLLALRAQLRTQGWFATTGIPEPNLGEYLDIVALGTVADLVTLDHNNRVLVAQGVQRIRAGRSIPAISALLKCGKRETKRATAGDLGFVVAPRLNAAGRLTDMSIGIECLLADDPSRAGDLAAKLDQINRERREIEAQMQDDAVQELDRMGFNESDPALPFGLCLFNENWHQGVVGLVASRITERVHRPVIAFARVGDTTLKGSARSVKGLHIRDVLAAVDVQNPGLISKYGGHAMAAGLTLTADGLELFSKAFDTHVRRWLPPGALAGIIHTDGELAPQYLTVECAGILRDAGPWGQGFPEPVFDGVFHLLERRRVGRGHLKLLLAGPDTHQRFEAIAFNETGAHLPPDCQEVRIVYRPDVSDYQGSRRLQIVIDYIEAI